MLASDSGPPLRPEGLAKEEQHSLPTPARLSGRKAWPNTASDSDPRIRPGMHRTHAYSSSPTGTVGADWDQPTGDARSVRTQETGREARHSSQSQYQGPYPIHLQDSNRHDMSEGYPATF